MGRSRSGGFTLVELLVVIAIIGVLTALALPAVDSLMRMQRVRSVSADLFADLTYARGEAIARGHDVIVQSTSNSNDWLTGWNIRDVTSGESLRTQGAAPSAMDFTATAASVTFDRTGRTNKFGEPPVSFTIKPTDTSAPDDQKRCVRIDPSGRARSVTGACA